MALTLRLNLRMQKEVKLLLSDPPPGASFPSLSSDHSSLSSIYAQLEGPEGSVYATGIFGLKIGIPERYPFQPPAVTFLTPIYHPNIDNGGRICLDILNLPPKGAWQPSLNISTVLTSIGLLLSEPNPDDGLMCEASREYKYNRQAFDRKARAMTEKYAKARARGHSSDTECMEINLHSRTVLEAEVSDKVPKDDVADVSCQEKQHKIRKKVSLDSFGSTSKRDNDGEAKDHSQLNPENPMESGQSKELINMAENCSHIHRRLRGKGGKLSLESFIQSNQKDSHKIGEGPTVEHSNSPSNPQSSLMAPKGSPLELPGDSCEEVHQCAHKFACSYKTAIPERHGQSCQTKGLGSADERHVVENDGQKPVSSIKLSSSPTPSNLSCGPNRNALPVSYDKLESGDDCGGKAGNNATGTMLQKSSFSGKKLSLGLIVQPMQQEKVDKENLWPISVPSTNKQTGINQLLLQPQDSYTDASKRQLHDQHQNGQIGENQQGQELLVAESVIVLDSEDSEDSGEESEGLFTSKSLLTRKRAVKRSVYS